MSSFQLKYRPVADALDSLSIGVCILDSNLKVLFWNQYMRAWTHIESEEIETNCISDFFPEFNNSFVQQQISQVLSGWPSVVFASQLHDPLFVNKKNPSEIFVQSVKISEFSASDSENFLMISVENLTDMQQQIEIQNLLYQEAKNEIELREESVRKLEESESKLKEMDQMKNQLFSIIGHDLRSPMATILQFSDLMIKKPENLKVKNIQNVYDITKSSLDLLNNLLDWAKIQMDGISFNPAEIEIHSMAEDVINQYQTAADVKGIKLLNEIPFNTLLHADQNLAYTLFRNLCWNAIKYTEKEGWVKFDYSYSIDKHRITISDDGHGLDQQTIDSLLGKERVKSKFGTNNEKGTGLGVKLCRDIMELHHGELHIQSEVHKGTSITLVF